MLIGQLEDSRDISIGFRSGAQFDPIPRHSHKREGKQNGPGCAVIGQVCTVPSQSSNHDVAELHISSMALQANVACR